MIFKKTKLDGAFLIVPEPILDARGFFARTWCKNEVEGQQLNPDVAQCSISFNKRRGTLRGMHYQAPPHSEVKVVRCIRGSVFDVIIDLRRTSPTFLQWYGVELSCENRYMLYIPEGLAHGFQTLVDDTELFYQMSTLFAPDAARGVRWNDPSFGIQWPLSVEVISKRDAEYPDFTP